MLASKTLVARPLTWSSIYRFLPILRPNFENYCTINDSFYRYTNYDSIGAFITLDFHRFKLNLKLSSWRRRAQSQSSLGQLLSLASRCHIHMMIFFVIACLVGVLCALEQPRLTNLLSVSLDYDEFTFDSQVDSNNLTWQHLTGFYESTGIQKNNLGPQVITLHVT